MGCDIHFYSERRDHHNNWKTFDFFELNDWYEDELKQAKKKGWPPPEEFRAVVIDDDRWYMKFAVLSAGVRDYNNEAPWAFEPRGVPDDCCKEIKNEYARWNGDAHSANWITLKEFNDMYIKYRLRPWGGENPLAEMKKKIDDHIKRKLRWQHIIDEQNPEDIRFIFWFDN